MDLATILQILDSAVRLMTPLLLACLAGLYSERSGVFDIGLEGKMLMAAFTSAATAAVTGKWHVDAKGYCSKWGNNNENCFTVKQDGTKYTVLDSSGKAVATWVPAAAPAASAAAATPAKPK